jgi:hypothetical protein
MNDWHIISVVTNFVKYDVATKIIFYFFFLFTFHMYWNRNKKNIEKCIVEGINNKYFKNLSLSLCPQNFLYLFSLSVLYILAFTHVQDYRVAYNSVKLNMSTEHSIFVNYYGLVAVAVT